MTVLRKADEIFTAEEYLALEATSETKQECVFGSVYAMAGTSIPHNDIAGNIYAQLHFQLRGKPCRPSFADVKLKARVVRRVAGHHYVGVVVILEADHGHLEFYIGKGWAARFSA